MDLGSGDGRGPYRWALAEPHRMFLATDANPDALADIALKAARKPARGGIPNLLCVAEPFDKLAHKLGAVADRVSVILPWGGLLRAVIAPDLEALSAIRTLCVSGATLEIVASYDETLDARLSGPLCSVAIHEYHLRHVLPQAYASAGFAIQLIEKVNQRRLQEYQTTWAGRLAFGKPREVWRVVAVTVTPLILTKRLGNIQLLQPHLRPL